MILNEGGDEIYGDRGVSYVTFNPDQVKLTTNENPSENEDIRYSRNSIEKYSYKNLVAKPEIKLTVINTQKQYFPSKGVRKSIVAEGITNAKKVGIINAQGNPVVYVKDNNMDVIVSKRGLEHGLDRRFKIVAPVVENIGSILQNAIEVNEMTPEMDIITDSYFLVSAAKNEMNELYIVGMVVNRASNKLESINVLYSVNTKTEPAGSLSPPPLEKSGMATGSSLSIEKLLEYVNKYYPDVLPEDVLRYAE